MVVVRNLSDAYFRSRGAGIYCTEIYHSSWYGSIILEHAHGHKVPQLYICREYVYRHIFRHVDHLNWKNAFFATRGSTGIVTDTVEGSTRVPGGHCNGISTVVVSVRLRNEMCSVDMLSIDDGMPFRE